MSGRGGHSYGSGSMGYNDLGHMVDEAEKDVRRQAIARLAGVSELGNENKQTDGRTTATSTGNAANRVG